MTTAPDPLDLRARQLHADALEHLSPATLARLRAALGRPSFIETVVKRGYRLRVD